MWAWHQLDSSNCGENAGSVNLPPCGEMQISGVLRLPTVNNLAGDEKRACEEDQIADEHLKVKCFVDSWL